MPAVLAETLPDATAAAASWHAVGYYKEQKDTRN